MNPRGYKTVEEAYVHTFKSWNETVRPADIVFNLGDWVVGAGTNSLNVTKEINELHDYYTGKEFYEKNKKSK